MLHSLYNFETEVYFGVPQSHTKHKINLLSLLLLFRQGLSQLSDATSFSAKFDPPSIVKILAGSGCLKVNWSMSQQQTWMKNYKLNLEVRLRAADSGQWPEQLVSTIPSCYNGLCWVVQAHRSDLVCLLWETW